MSADTTALARLGRRKAAVLLIQLGQSRAASILGHLSESEVEALTSEIARLGAVTPDEADAVLSEFLEMAEERSQLLQGGIGFAQQILEEGIGGERAGAIIGRLNAAAMQMPFHFLHRADPAQLRTFIIEEHPQVIAMVVAHLSAEKASIVMAGLDPAIQADVAYRIACMERTLPEVSAAVESTLERRLASMLQPAEMARVGGVDPLVDIINVSDRTTERQIVEGLEGLDPELAEEIKSRMFMFEDILTIDDRYVQLIVRGCNNADLATALKGVKVELRDKILSNMSERAAADLNEEMDVLGAVRLKQVEEAQAAIIRVIRGMEESGEIVLRRGAEDELVS